MEERMPKETPNQRRERLGIYQLFSESGQTITEFSRERGLTYWKVKAAVRKTEVEGNNGSGFREVALPEAAGTGDYAVTLRNGRELRVPAHFSEKRVRQLVEILESC